MTPRPTKHGHTQEELARQPGDVVVVFSSQREAATAATGLEGMVVQGQRLCVSGPASTVGIVPPSPFLRGEPHPHPQPPDRSCNASVASSLASPPGSPTLSRAPSSSASSVASHSSVTRERPAPPRFWSVLFLGLTIRHQQQQQQQQQQSEDRDRGGGKQPSGAEDDHEVAAQMEGEILRLCAQHGRVVASARRYVVTVRPPQPGQQQQGQGERADTAGALHVEVGFADDGSV